MPADSPAPFGFEAPQSTPRPWGQPITVGVLGGMGPYATLQFLKNVLDLTPAAKDWEHVRTVVDSNCHVPSRSRALLYGEASPLPGMIDSCSRLSRYPVDVIALPCNSACYWLPDLRRAVKTPVLDIVALAVKALMRESSVKRVAALSGAVPYRTELYRAPVERLGGTYVKLDERDQDRVVTYIESVKSLGTANPEATAAFASFVGELAQRYAIDGVVLACTEFSFFWNAEFPVKVVDSSRSLAATVVDYAVHGVPLELDAARVKAFWDKRAAMITDGAVGLLQSTMLTSSEADAAARLDAERKALLSVLEPLIGKDSRVLELGSGTGRWSCVVGPLVRHVDAWDYSEGLVAAARRQAGERGVENVTFHVGSVEDIATDQKYDLVLSVALLHYLDEPRFEAAMRVARETVTPGGYAVFRETFGVQRRFELHGFHSATLDCDYHAVYRTVPEIARELGDDFELVTHEMTLAPTQDKPETCQGVAVFRRKEPSIAGGSPR